MMKMTSAVASKMLRKLSDDKEYWNNREREGCTYVASLDEEPVIPEYDYSEVAKTISDIDDKMMKIRHAINIANCTNKIQVGDSRMTVDMILVKMAQLNKRREFLDNLRKNQPKERIRAGYLPGRNMAPEYKYINYDIELIKHDYDKVEACVTEMQIALDKYNQTVEFDVDI